MNRKQLLSDVLGLCIALRDDVRKAGFLECTLFLADRHTYGFFSMRRIYDGSVVFRERDEHEAAPLGFLRYDLRFLHYKLAFSWRRNRANDREWECLVDLKGRYAAFDPMYFAAFVKAAGSGVADWLTKSGPTEN